MSETSIEFDDGFKDEMRRIVSQARALVRNSDMHDSLRIRLLSHLAAIEKDVARGKTAFHAVAESFIDLSHAMAEGAKNLDPILERIKELAGAFRKQEVIVQIEHDDLKKLPAPDENLES